MSAPDSDADPRTERVRALRDELDAMRPLDAEQVGKAMQRLRLEWTYHSNAIEGNSLTYGETRALLMHGVTAQGKPLKDHLDVKGHREALDYLERFVRAEEPLTLAAIREIHRVLLGDPYETWAETPEGVRVRRTITPGEFKTQPNSVKTETGETHYYARPEETPALMQDLVDDYRAGWPHVEAGGVDAVAFAADIHHRFAAVHPFDDGNGRMARLLMNLVLMRAGYPPAVIRQENRPAYYGALAEADAGSLDALVRFVGGELEATLDLYLRTLRGEPDPTAFSRRVALLKKEVETSGGAVERSPEALAKVSQSFVIPLIERLAYGLDELSSLFAQSYLFVSYNDLDGNELSVRDREFQLLASKDWSQIEALLTLEGYRGDASKDEAASVQVRSAESHVIVKEDFGGVLERLAYGEPFPDPVEVADRVLGVVVQRIGRWQRPPEPT